VIQAEAEKAKEAALNGEWLNSTDYWESTEHVVIDKTHGVDFYNIHEFNDYWNFDWVDDDKPELQLMLNAGGSNCRFIVKSSLSSQKLRKLDSAVTQYTNAQ